MVGATRALGPVVTLSRRDALRLLGAGALGTFAAAATTSASGCSLLGSGSPEPRLLESEGPLPAPFRVPLPVPAVAKPVRTDATTDYYDLSPRVAEQEILPGLRTRIWGYAGAFPGPTLEARSGRRVVVHQTNQLPVPVVTHLHGGRTPAASDGYPTDLLLPSHGDFPGRMGDPRANVARGSRGYDFPMDQRAAALWYHDHRMDFTAPQVWRGLAGMCFVRDDDEDALPLPRGEQEVPLLICDRAFDADGTLRYPALDPELRAEPGVREAYAGGVLGDVILVNGAPWPSLDVSTRRYRFRILNASNARRYELSLDPVPHGSPVFVQIGGDGGLLERPLARSTLTLAPAERLDVVVDFTGSPVGTTVLLRNSAAEGPAGRVMRFRVVRKERDETSVPPRLSRIERLDPARAVATRDLSFESGDVHGHSGWTINGDPFDPIRATARPRFGSTEVWRLTSDVAHPVHLHLVHFQVLTIDGERPAADLGWKDTIDLRPAQTVEIIARFDGYRGRYAFHCHNLEHEDMAMMGNFEVV
ncbi:multicopper oxidase family protein [Actinopolymorpha pittospori]|uniref:Multicopper oxidase CueO n=1 Tax=Actinopolymorpha pittospori TaxID=648752 RepID=A0A927RD07_9ACTN|nr:spore coat protein A [Actinopolymorpha pittospori]